MSAKADLNMLWTAAAVHDNTLLTLDQVTVGGPCSPGSSGKRRPADSDSEEGNEPLRKRIKRAPSSGDDSDHTCA